MKVKVGKEGRSSTLKKRIVIALLSAVIFSFIMSYISYTPMAGREANAWYESFNSFVQVYLIFSVPAYLLGGVSVSFYVVKYVEKEMIRLPLYLLGGVFLGVAVIVISFMTMSFEVWKYGLVGLCASFLYYVLLLVANRIGSL